MVNFNKLRHPSNCVAAHHWCSTCKNNTMHDVVNGWVVRASCWVCRDLKITNDDIQGKPEPVFSFANIVSNKIKSFTNHVKTLSPDAHWSISDDLDRTLIIIREEIRHMIPSGNTLSKFKKDGIPTLTYEQLSTSEKKCRILGARVQESNWGKQLKIKVAVDGQSYFWYLKLDSEQLGVLKSKLGDDENDYVNAEILLSLSRDDFEEKYNIVVGFPKPKKTA